MRQLPSGTTTFLFTDIEGSTRLWETVPEKMRVALRRHHEILQCAIESQDGVVFQIVGDAFCAAFHTAPSAVFAAIKAQQELYAAKWDLPNPIRVRMGIHTGLAEPVTGELATGGYTSNQTLNRVARIMSAGHGGQILLSLATEELARDALPKISKLQDLGEHRLRDVIHPEHLFQLNINGLSCDFPPLKTLDLRRHNLPVQLTEFIGREKELAEIESALAQNRLVTVIGSGGTGKTRLAIEAGAAQIINSQIDNRFPHGVYFVALAPLEKVEAIIPTISTALGFSFYEGSEPRQQLLNYLREKSLLLILDNFEHLLTGVDLVTEILNRAPQVKILATSRARLNIAGEQLFHLTGMQFPNWEAPQDAIEYGAVKLFMQTAHQVRPDFELTIENVKFIVRLCRLVEGIPLGVLLAASWMEMLSPEEIAREIERGIDFLESKQRDLPERQHSMRAVFDYSWKLLTPSEQSVFSRASVFRGGFTREAVQRVTDASLRDLIGLVDKSLLQRDSGGRYQIHELLRQYGAEKLSCSANDEYATRAQHCSYFAEFLYQREKDWHGERQRQILGQIEAEVENIRAGWNWAVEQSHISWMTAYLESMCELYQSRGRLREGAAVVAAAAQKLSERQNRDTATQILFGRLLMWQGVLSSGFDIEDHIDQHLQASVAIFRELGESRNAAYALQTYGALHWYRNSASSCQESLQLFQQYGDQRGIALASQGLAWAALHQGYYPAAKQRFQESLLLFRKLCDQREIARTLDGLGYVCWILGEYQAAKQHHEEMSALSQEISDQISMASALGSLGVDMYGQRNYEQAKQFWTASLALDTEIGDVGEIANQLGDLAEVALAEGHYAQAMQLAQRSCDYYALVLRDPHSWDFRIMGKAALGLGDLKMAQTYLRQSFEQALKIRRWGFALLTLVGVAALFVEQEKDKRAFELLALVMNHHASWQMAKDQATPLITQLEDTLPPAVIDEARERGGARDLEATVMELLEELQE